MLCSCIVNLALFLATLLSPTFGRVTDVDVFTRETTAYGNSSKLVDLAYRSMSAIPVNDFTHIVYCFNDALPYLYAIPSRTGTVSSELRPFRPQIQVENYNNKIDRWFEGMGDQPAQTLQQYRVFVTICLAPQCQKHCTQFPDSRLRGVIRVDGLGHSLLEMINCMMVSRALEKENLCSQLVSGDCVQHDAVHRHVH